MDAINSVQFSNHTQYEHVSGQILKKEELADVVDGLRKNDLLSSYSHLLTGRRNPLTYNQNSLKPNSNPDIF